MEYLSTVRVLDTDYRIKDEDAARINHTHKVEEIEGAAKEGHQHQASEIAGLSTVATSGSYSDLNGKPSAATESADGLMTSADKKKLDGIQAGAGSYTHPTHTAHESGLYKVAVDSLGHVSSATAVTKGDITALGIPAQDTDTTYGKATSDADGLMSAADKSKLDGIAAGAQANAVTSVNGKTGAVKLGASVVGAASASHTHPASQVSGLASVATSGKYADLAGAPSSMKNPAALTVQANGKTVATYDGSSAATASITPANIGAAPSSHTHPYLPLSGGTLTGNVAAPKFKGPPEGNVTGNASTASRLSTAITINLTGAVSGSAKFDGSGNVSISTTAKAPKFEYDSATGNLYYVTEE